MGSLLTSAAIGAIIKIIAAVAQNWMDNREQRNRHMLAKELLWHKNDERFAELFAEGETNSYTRVTRRLLAVMFVGTFCLILSLWTVYPTATIYIYQPTNAFRLDILWGLFGAKSELVQVPVTTGALVWEALHPLSMVFMAYFTPIGKR